MTLEEEVARSGIPLSRNLEFERLMLERAETAQGIWQLQQSLGDTFEYFLIRIKELEARVAALESDLSATRERGGDDAQY